MNKGAFQTPSKSRDKKEKYLSPLKESAHAIKQCRSTEKIRTIFTNVKEELSEVGTGNYTSIDSDNHSPKASMPKAALRIEGNLKREHSSLAEFLISCRKTDGFKVRKSEEIRSFMTVKKAPICNRLL